MKSPYSPEIGDVIIGRIMSVEKKFWIVNINAQREGILNLTAINLPQGEQRIRSEEDAMQMRKFFKENDLLSGEIQQINPNGLIHIQTRNLKYGKLKNGILIKVNHGLIKKQKHQFIDLVDNIKAILGMNGCVWVYFSTVKIENEYFSDDKAKIALIEKDEKPDEKASILIILFSNIIHILDKNNINISQPNLMFCYEQFMELKGNKIKEENKDNKKLAKIDKSTGRDIIQLLIKKLNSSQD